MRYDSLAPDERAVLDAYEGVQILAWSHPTVEAFDRAMSRSLMPGAKSTPSRVRASALGRRCAAIHRLAHLAREVAGSALPSHGIGRAALWQCYPTCVIGRRLSSDEALAQLADIADRLA